MPSLIPNSLSRPADVFLPSWKRGRPAALDVTTMQQATINGAASTQGHARFVGEARKLSSHGTACQAVGVTFIPLVIETLGGMSSSAVSTLAGIGLRMGIPPSDFTRHLFQRRAISVWRGNAALGLRRVPTLAPSVDGVY